MEIPWTYFTPLLKWETFWAILLMQSPLSCGSDPGLSPPREQSIRLSPLTDKTAWTKERDRERFSKLQIWSCHLVYFPGIPYKHQTNSYLYPDCTFLAAFPTQSSQIRGAFSGIQPIFYAAFVTLMWVWMFLQTCVMKLYSVSIACHDNDTISGTW